MTLKPEDLKRLADDWLGAYRRDAVFRQIKREPEAKLALHAAIDTVCSERDAALQEVGRLRKALGNIRPFMVPGMNWTDDIGEVLKKMADDALAGTQGGASHG